MHILCGTFRSIYFEIRALATRVRSGFMEVVKILGFQTKLKLCIMNIAWCLKGKRKGIKNSTSARNYVKLTIIDIKTLNGNLS